MTWKSWAGIFVGALLLITAYHVGYILGMRDMEQMYAPHVVSLP